MLGESDVKTVSFLDESSEALSLFDCLKKTGWWPVIESELKKEYLIKIASFLKKEPNFLPKPSHIFTWALLTDPKDVKVVILGQDPYHDPSQPHGLAFSVQKGVPPPPSLRNIFQELVKDISGFERPKHGNLESWARQGVLLLNTILTVVPNKPLSHGHLDWHLLARACLDHLQRIHQKNLVFMLWGKHAQAFAKGIDRSKHLVLEATHPSPLSASRGFFGCKHFSKANEYLKQNGRDTIDWSL